MISRYNSSQIIIGLLSALGSIVCYGAAWLFFRYMPAWVAYNFHWKVPPYTFPILAMVLLAAVSWSFGAETAGALVVDYYAHRVTGPAYLLAQLFTAGPLLALRAITHFRNLVKAEPGLEERLQQVLGKLRALNKWQGLQDQPDVVREIFLLAKMDQIDFSAAKGKPRFKASPPDH